jgi:hypothetical protein
VVAVFVITETVLDAIHVAIVMVETEMISILADKMITINILTAAENVEDISSHKPDPSN